MTIFDLARASGEMDEADLSACVDAREFVSIG
jgi:hypothetical protein